MKKIVSQGIIDQGVINMRKTLTDFKEYADSALRKIETELKLDPYIDTKTMFSYIEYEMSQLGLSNFIQ